MLTLILPLAIRQTVGCVATVTPTLTIQPTPKTVTANTVVYVTKTTTLPNTKVQTLTSTNTVQSTTSVTGTITSTALTTVVVATVTAPKSTITVATSPGFVPVSSNCRIEDAPSCTTTEAEASETGDLKRRQWNNRRRDIEVRGQSSSSGYPNTVTCG